MNNRLCIDWAFRSSIAGVLICLTGGAWAVTPSELDECLAEPGNDKIVECFRTLTNKAKAAVQSNEQALPTPKTDNNPKLTSTVCPGDHPIWTTCYVDKQTNREANDWAAEDTRKVITENMEASYITARSGKRFEGDKTAGDMLYEAQIFKNISWIKAPAKKGGGTSYWLDVPIRIGLRQLTDDSMPVRTPSYNPGLRLFFAPQGDNPSISGKKLWYYSVGLHHYSNGQDGQSMLPDGSVNTRSGSFNTNYVEAAAHATGNMGELNWARLSFRQHFYGTFEPFQRDQYEKRHLSLELRTREYFVKYNIPTHFRLTGTYGWGYGYVVKNDVDPTQNIVAHARDKLNTTIELIARPTLGKRWSWNDLAAYVRYDYGHDYYNINFQNRINRLQVGVVATNF